MIAVVVLIFFFSFFLLLHIASPCWRPLLQVEHHEAFVDDERATPLVVCPCCEKKYLTQARSVLLCACGFRLDTQNDGVSLKHVKARLGVCTEEHSAQCTHAPSFAVHSDYGLNALYLECAACRAFMLVI